MKETLLAQLVLAAIEFLRSLLRKTSDAAKKAVEAAKKGDLSAINNLFRRRLK